MNERASDVVERLRESRSLVMLRLVDDAQLDAPLEPEPDPETVVQPYLWLRQRIGAGIRLTQAGYLPPALVTEAMTELDWAHDWPGKHNREEQTVPVLELRESAQRFGLVRKNRGQLLVTKLGQALAEDPARLWSHLASRLPEARSEIERQAGAAYLLSVAAGRARNDQLLADAMSALGWHDRDTYQPLTRYDAFEAARPTWAVLRTLGLQPRKARWDAPEPTPPAAAIRFARGCLLGSSATNAEPERPAAERLIELTVTLRDTDPPIWRRLRVGASLTLAQLHRMIQVAMGWQDYHLHRFEIAGVLYGDVEDVQGWQIGDEQTCTVGQVAAGGSDFRYEYDFGDGWEHEIGVSMLAAVGSGVPQLIAGERACPPEDCGGTGGYQHLLAVLADPAHTEHQHLLTWLGGSFDPESFDVESVNTDLALVDRQTRQRR